MKIVKYLFFLLILIIAAFTVFISTQNTSYNIKQDSVIDLPRNLVYNHVNDYTNWTSINIFPKTNSSTRYIYSEITYGTGATAKWKTGDLKNKLETTKVIEYDSIIQSLYTDKKVSQITWSFKDTLKGATAISIKVKGKLDFKEKVYSLLGNGVKDYLEESIQEGFSKIEHSLKKEVNDYTINIKGKIVKDSTFYIGYPINGNISEINKNTTTVLPKLLRLTDSLNIKTNGAPFIIYDTYNIQSDSASYTVCIPLKESFTQPLSSEFKNDTLQPFTAIKSNLRGHYSHLKETRLKAYRHSVKDSLEIDTIAKYIEVYNNRLNQPQRSSKWITDTFLPIKADSLKINSQKHF
ncbi:MAG: hypothetical protein BM557_05365 [Flavobacterium sp. MedPE-SWcel]|uniref:hypothetical protein n=1 Tax=uncultured Flavobacterium sp. TaxID=165435 RepID=UPI0009243563|nr:hypothetical protein [uncultured Flavobacterium sp.]OIQ20102.1 MAG: hypothetical protein BM557_05365 [Flavobacterium sp. MedPE-SWcel]